MYTFLCFTYMYVWLVCWFGPLIDLSSVLSILVKCAAHVPMLSTKHLALNVTHSSAVSMSLRSGYPVISIPLPSRKEMCDFTLRPHLQTVADISKQIMAEDKGVDRSASCCDHIQALAPFPGAMHIHFQWCLCDRCNRIPWLRYWLFACNAMQHYRLLLHVILQDVVWEIPLVLYCVLFTA